MRKSQYSLENQVLLEMLKTGRLERRLRQRDLASRLGGGQAMVSKVESGERRLDVIELRTWLIALGLDFVAFATELDERIRTRVISRPWLFNSGGAPAGGQGGRRKPTRSDEPSRD